MAEVSERLSVSPPKCQSAHELHTLISTRGIVEGFVSFCALDGMSSKATSGYIDGLKFYAVGLEGVAMIPGSLVISRMLDGLAKLDRQSF